MKQPRVKGQALALVLIVVVVSVIIAFSITSRVVQDIKQQGEERASTRAEAIADAAVENLTLKIQGSDQSIVPASGEKYKTFSISSDLGLCDPNSSDVSKQCDAKSVAQINYYKQVIQFKLFDSEDLEVFMTDTKSTTPVQGAQSAMMLHLKALDNNSFTMTGSKVLVKGYYRTLVNSKPELRLLSECIVDLGTGAASCLPSNYLTAAKVASCPTNIPIDANPADSQPAINTSLGDTCFTFKANVSGYGVSFYRVKPLLARASGSSATPYVDISATGVDAATYYDLPVAQMALINSGVYSGTTGSDQQVFQQSTRLMLLNKAVPEVLDYVLYNGSNSPISKSY